MTENILQLDGSTGEGGGQILRTSLSMSALTQRPFSLRNIRARRKRPGLRPQHLTAVRAVAAVCNAELTGDEVDSTELMFVPRSQPQGGTYLFDVAENSLHGSAGAVALIMQSLWWPLQFASAPATVTLRGGTHVPFGPTYHYIEHVALPAFRQLGADGEVKLNEWGWLPKGLGEMMLEVRPITHLNATDFAVSDSAENSAEISGIAVASNLPSHIPNRMARRATNLLEQMGVSAVDIRSERNRAPCDGAGIFLWQTNAGFGVIGRRGVPADKVAEQAVDQYRAFMDNHAAVDQHLADQLLIPLALANGTSRFTTERLTRHTYTNADVLRQWLGVEIEIQGQLNQPGTIVVTGTNFSIPQS